jgi:hypothetical protein
MDGEKIGTGGGVDAGRARRFSSTATTDGRWMGKKSSGGAWMQRNCSVSALGWRNR